MNKMVFGLILVLSCVPLSACNQQHGNKTTAVHERERKLDRDRADNDFGRRRGGGHGLRRACAADLQQYCEGKERGRARRECLQSHMAQLSAECKAAVEARGRGHRRRDDSDD